MVDERLGLRPRVAVAVNHPAVPACGDMDRVVDKERHLPAVREDEMVGPGLRPAPVMVSPD
ncbi:MAG: hypothetical protein A4E35_01973 [Methanoregula sp. PtaU1.Bin051]|nr:MAG: hypothetical protein A4E35_01973 [Methanoregula sp. PtaU1.Bin051]